MKLRKALLRYEDQSLELDPGKMTFHEGLYADFSVEQETMARNGIAGCCRYSIMLHPKRTVQSVRLVVEFEMSYAPTDRIFCNGYQSWTETRSFSPSERIPDISWVLRPFAERLGDYRAVRENPRAPLHAWTYSYVESAGGHVRFIGGVLERTGMTLIRHFPEQGICRVEKILEGMQLEHSFPAFECWTGEARSPEPLLDEWFRQQETPARSPARKILGWTSWYRHFTDIDEKKILGNLEALDLFRADLPEELRRPESADWVFQIDDGWQEATGDWGAVRKAIPAGMGDLAAKIRDKGFMPGLWLAPFVAAENSELYRKNRHWFLRGPQGRPLPVGYNPYWKGRYFALDIYRKEVREYLAAVLWQIRERWGYGLVKLDFLFAAALAPPSDKNSGQMMYDAMEFLRECAGPMRILACGVPLGTAFGRADYCRIGPDVHLRWEHRLLKWLGARERLDTRQSLVNTFARRHLDGRAFRVDPDVVVLREQGQHLEELQRHTLLTVNTLLGSVLFCSDDLRELPGEIRTRFASAIEMFLHAEVLSSRLGDDGRYEIAVRYRGKKHFLDGQL